MEGRSLLEDLSFVVYAVIKRIQLFQLASEAAIIEAGLALKNALTKIVPYTLRAVLAEFFLQVTKLLKNVS